MKKSSKSVAKKAQARASTPKKVLTTKATSREKKYSQFFSSTPLRSDSDEFIPQVHGYGTPIYSQVSSFSGV